ncbi:uncharacterized protein TM35_000211210 [Trypanosoma theileri]|uniref:Uncharacterized protein n=1 Tax=Trypanosoma theileri TaxID=67003 RepID=A0A1X0NS31_9TRYP|nr:uncharacterized protein TM35_000211210 [Trypanosoma theileri]ORC87515.1 hypothetical protein TM35_000211210 [Trypanosoma theileri]
MSRSVGPPPAVVSGEPVVVVADVEKEILSSDDVTAAETVNTELSHERQLLSSNLKSSGLSNDLDGVAVDVHGSLKQEDLFLRGRPVLRNLVEPMTRGNPQRQLSASYERSCPSPSYFMYPVDSHPMCEKSVTKKDVANLGCKCPDIPPVNLDTLDKADVTTKESTDVQERKYVAESSTRQNLSAPLHPVPQTRNGTEKCTVLSTQDLQTQQGTISFNKETVNENSFLLPYQAPHELIGTGEERSLSHPPSFELGSKQDMQASLVSIAPNAFGFCLPEPFYWQSHFGSTLGSSNGAVYGSNDNTQLSVLTGINGSTNVKLNFPHPGFERELSSLSQPGLENIHREVNSMWHVRGNQFCNSARMIRCRMNSSELTGTEGQSKPLIHSNRSNEGSKALSSHWGCLPQFANILDVSELIEGGNRNLSNPATFIVPVLGSFVSEGEEGIAVGNSQDSRTLASLSLFSP